jgi:signal transduction histidine kinase
VDDHPTNIVILQEILDDAYVLATAASGEEALAMAPDFQPALILLDIMMPGIDGYETCRRIRALPPLRHMKIIMVSANGMLSERLQGYAAGADDYITKPFDAAELLAKVRVYLRLKSAEELAQLKTDLLALLQHEVRTPLNGIIAPVQMLMTDPDLAETERREFLEMVHHSAVRLCTLFDKVMTLSAMKSGAWDFQPTASDLCIAVRHAIHAVSAQATTRHVQIEPQLPDSAPALLDHGQMQWAVIALLENAIRFSPSHERVVVRVQRDGAHVCLRVTDHGMGIEAGLLARVFEEFTPADVAHHTAGHGLSLAIVQQIVQAHQGTISVESVPGVGTTFTVHLPLLGSADRRHEAVCLAAAT